MKGVQILGILAAIALIVFSAVYPVPEKYVFVSSSRYAYDYSWSENTGAEYLGGDAYNYQVEASLKAGYLTGVLALKAITFVGGVLLFFTTLYSRVKCAAIEAQTHMLTELAHAAEKSGKTLEQLHASSASQLSTLGTLSAAVHEHFAPKAEETDETII